MLLTSLQQIHSEVIRLFRANKHLHMSYMKKQKWFCSQSDLVGGECTIKQPQLLKQIHLKWLRHKYDVLISR